MKLRLLPRIVSALGLGLLLASQSGCTSLAYVTQAAVGQNDLSIRARDIDELVRDKHVSPRMRELLSEVALIKRYGERHGLTATTNYTKYVRVDRPAVVWVVSASEPLRFHSKIWSFPLVGSFTYLGWFKRDAADGFAKDLREEGWDVDVRGSAAYSTQGYFEDPVVSTMIPAGKEALGVLANTILHESAHASFFVPNQSTLNESVANFVGDTLGARYVEDTRGSDAPEAVAYVKSEHAYDQRRRELREAFHTLEALYASPKSDAEKLAEKKGILAHLQTEMRTQRPINNATLIQYRTYNSGQDELAKLLAACDGDWRRFLDSLRTLRAHPNAPPQESDVGKMVTPLIAAHCPR
ncbi:MAG TPA: aminopeptidase [Polyangiaceae bacterium]